MADKSSYEEVTAWLNERDGVDDTLFRDDIALVRPHLEALGRELESSKQREELVRKEGADLAAQILETYHVNAVALMIKTGPRYDRRTPHSGLVSNCANTICSNYRKEIAKLRGVRKEIRYV